MDNKPLVAIHCITYNHEPYIREALEGFVMQKTNFPFVAIVHDDASTDRTAEIMREYAEKYPDIIKPIYETENQYSKRDGSLGRIMNAAIDATGAKYVAVCEGDDYWTDPLKLQKQVDFLESHPDYSMCATNSFILNENKTLYKSTNFVENSKDISLEEIILRGGSFIETATILIRSYFLKNIPYQNKNFHVGDFPLKIYMAYMGKVCILNDITTVYRINSNGSWTARHRKLIETTKGVKEYVNKDIYILKTMDILTEKKYSKVFNKRIVQFSHYFYYKVSALCELKLFLTYPCVMLKEIGIKEIFLGIIPYFIRNKILKIE